MKKFCIFLCSFIIFSSVFFISASAASYNAYGSVTDSTSQVQQLISYYLQDADLLDEFIVIRIGEYDYRLFYSRNLLDDSSVSYIDYSRYSVGSYNYEYRYSTGIDSDFSFNLGIYTAVGNISGSKILYSSSYDSWKTNFYIRIILISIFVIFVFSVFRIHMGKKREVRF